MVRRIEHAVVRGEIDNTVEGRTTGRLWLVGREEPVTLDLAGDCWRDLAGTRLTFSNPEPGENERLAAFQKGVVGDMTASRRSREFARDAGEGAPEVWRNSLYLEWFSESDGRVLLEAGHFRLKLGERVWAMDADAEGAQRASNTQAMRDYIQGVIARRKPAEDDDGESDEFEWEQRLRESDRLTDAYQEVLEKYDDDPDAEFKGAFVMGWDGLLERLAEASELDTDEKGSADGDEDDGPDWRDALDDVDEDIDDDELFRTHPLQEEAQDQAMRAIDLIRGEDVPGAGELIAALTEVAGKLAGALNGTYERETGFVLAVLKRCQARQNEALGACGRLIERADDHDRERALEALRDEIHVLRGRLTDMRQELRKS